jgi:hypothetical protein
MERFQESMTTTLSHISAHGSRLDTHTIQDFAALLDGSITSPEDAGYDAARAVWNGMIDRHPAIIAHCASVRDVINAVAFAREHDLLVAVRGGDHNVAGHATCDGGIVIDLSPMKSIAVDVENRLAHAGAGVTWGELDAATQVHGLATPGGVYSDTGIAGLTLGGGYGWLRNAFGLSCDNLIEAEVVTADGRVLIANESENTDLLWGLRGGGGNFGIVTRFSFRLHPVGPEVYFAFAFHDGSGERMQRALRLYRDYSMSAPDEVSTLAACGIIPAHGDLFPAEIQGRPFVLLGGLYAGPVAEGERILQPLRDLDTPLIDFSGAMPYVEAQKAFDEDYPDGMRYYWKSLNLSSLDDEVIERIELHARRQPSDLSTTDLWHIGGAVTRVAPEASAFHGRSSAFLLSPEANWEDPADDEANIGWLRAFIDDMREFSDGSRYLNFAGFHEEGEELIRDAFGPQHARLIELKRTYDPSNLFRLNQNISPA